MAVAGLVPSVLSSPGRVAIVGRGLTVGEDPAPDPGLVGPVGPAAHAASGVTVTVTVLAASRGGRAMAATAPRYSGRRLKECMLRELDESVR